MSEQVKKLNWFQCAEIAKNRVRNWINRMEKDKIAATPAVLISVRHEAEHLGHVVLSTTEDLPDAMILSALETAVAELKRTPQKN